MVGVTIRSLPECGERPLNTHIEVRGARENNLRDISLDIPKKQITVFTGVSGSGKSSLVFDTIAAESQRQLNETYTAFAQSRMPHYGRPEFESLHNLSTAVIVNQQRLGGNARSTVGTITDINALLRLLYSRVAIPNAGFSNAYGFNDPQGMCPICDGLGHTSRIDESQLVDESLSIKEGAITFPPFAVGSWYWRSFIAAPMFPSDVPVREFTTEQRAALLHQEPTTIEIHDEVKSWNMTFEGVVSRVKRSFLNKPIAEQKGKLREALERVVTQGPCPACNGTRLNEKARSSLIAGESIADCAAMQVSDLAGFLRSVDHGSARSLYGSILERLDDLVGIGLGYLTLDRATTTLSGGESQRVKMVRHLGSSLTDLTYIFDEPSIGLHPADVGRLRNLILDLKEKGNTILVVEHDPDVIEIADHIVDMGPGAGHHGGTIVYEGSLDGLRESGTLTGTHLWRHARPKEVVRQPTGELRIDNATLHNLKDVSVRIPRGVMTVVTGVAGSGKSTLIEDFLPIQHPEAIFIDQAGIHASRRSNLATYTGILDPIRQLFAKANSVSASLFSANSEGACEECQGAGVIYTDLAFLDPIVSLCEICQGKRFKADVLQYRVRDKSISDVLELSVADAREFFHEKKIKVVLDRLEDVGLEYIALGQSLNTFSGGERQRLKLATALESKGEIYVFDEPTSGLHMSNVQRLLDLLNRIVDDGCTVIVIEHNLDTVVQADWVIDLGPGAGHDGGRIVFEGTPRDIMDSPDSLTGQHLARYVGRVAV
jgi:excinuclease UvrABC ATPase subunit